MMIFHYRQRNIKSIKLNLSINNTPIEQVKEFNFLGLLLDESLTWNSHIQKIASKIAGVNGTLSRLKRILPQEILKTIYNALVQPHLNYGILLWGKNTKRISKLHKRALRTITLSKYNAHTDPLFIKLKLLKIQDIYKLSILKFFFKYKKQLLPTYFDGIFDPIYRNHNYNTRLREQPVVTRYRTSAAKISIRHSLPEILSTTPSLIVEKLSTHSFNGFSNYIKQYYISQYIPTCRIDNCYICNRD